MLRISSFKINYLSYVRSVLISAFYIKLTICPMLDVLRHIGDRGILYIHAEGKKRGRCRENKIRYKTEYMCTGGGRTLREEKPAHVATIKKIIQNSSLIIHQQFCKKFGY